MFDTVVVNRCLTESGLLLTCFAIMIIGIKKTFSTLLNVSVKLFCIVI